MLDSDRLKIFIIISFASPPLPPPPPLTKLGWSHRSQLRHLGVGDVSQDGLPLAGNDAVRGERFLEARPPQSPRVVVVLRPGAVAGLRLQEVVRAERPTPAASTETQA